MQCLNGFKDYGVAFVFASNGVQEGGINGSCEEVMRNHSDVFIPFINAFFLFDASSEDFVWNHDDVFIVRFAIVVIWSS